MHVLSYNPEGESGRLTFEEKPVVGIPKCRRAKLPEATSLPNIVFPSARNTEGCGTIRLGAFLLGGQNGSNINKVDANDWLSDERCLSLASYGG